MKKILSIVLLAIFTIGIIPFASAQAYGIQGDVIIEGTTKDTASVDVNAHADARADKREQKKEERAEKRVEQKEKREQVKEERMEKRAEIREIMGIKKEVRAEIHERIQEHKKAFADFRVQLKDCKGKKTDDCENTRKQVRSEAKLYLKDTVQKTLEDLKKLHERVAASTIDNKERVLADLDAKITAVIALQAKVDALPADATAAQIQALTKELQQETTHIRFLLKVHDAKLINFGLNGVLASAAQLEKKMDKTIARLQEKGIDTHPADASIAAFKEHLQLARANADKAKAKFEEARTSETNFDALVKEGHGFLKTARDELRQAQNALKEAVHAIKTLREGTKTLTEETAKKEGSSATATVHASTSATTGTGTTETTTASQTGARA